MENPIFVRKSQQFPKAEKRQSPQVQTACSENIRQYLMSTSLHGLKYVGSIYITYFER